MKKTILSRLLDIFGKGRRFNAAVAPGRKPIPAGTRVRVRRDKEHGPGPWPAEPTGTVVVGLDHTHFVDVQAPVGVRRVYWVEFDEPQFDSEGDGPYHQAQILAVYLELLEG